MGDLGYEEILFDWFYISFVLLQHFRKQLGDYINPGTKEKSRKD
jgi:hypothetical protein